MSKQLDKLPEIIDLGDLLEETKGILKYEILQLKIESGRGLLSKDGSTALVNYIRLLKDLIKTEQTILNAMTDDELDKVTKKK